MFIKKIRERKKFEESIKNSFISFQFYSNFCSNGSSLNSYNNKGAYVINL